MATAEQRNHAKAYLRKAEEYLASAADNLAADRNTPAAGDAIHAGISAKDAIVTVLTGGNRKSKDHSAGAAELRQALGQRAEAAAAEKALRELISAKADVEYGVALVPRTRAEPLVRRARGLVELAVNVVRLGA